MVEELHSKTIQDHVLMQQATPFSESLVAERTPIIQINASYDLSILRDIQRTEATGTITSINSEYLLNIEGADSKALLLSGSKGRYTPGTAAEVGIGVRTTEKPPGDVVYYVGYLSVDENNDITDGACFGEDSEGVFVTLFRGGEQVYKVYQKNWNISSELNLQQGNVLQIRFTYYGYGLVEWRVLESKTGDKNQQVKTLHTFRPEGEPVLNNSNLNVGAIVQSGTETSSYNVYISGRQFSIIGRAEFKQRAVAHLVEGATVGTDDYVPIMTFRKKDGFSGVPISIQSHSIDTNNKIFLKWGVNTDISTSEAGGLVWETPSGSTNTETALEVNTNADSVDLTNAVLINQYQVIGGSPQRRTVSQDINVADIPDEYNVSLIAVAQTQEATVDAIGTMFEER